MASKNSERPNILVIISDDQGPWALGAAGNSEIITPNLDQLAADGARYVNFFCTSPVCSPARASLFTGRMPSQHGVHDHVVAPAGSPDAPDLLDGMTTYNEILAQNGYVGGLSGKWHLGASAVPSEGFDHWYAMVGGMSDYNSAPMYRDGSLVEEKSYITDLIADDAMEFIREAADDEAPFCLNVAFTAPHSPWVDQHPQQYLDLYQDCQFESCPQEPPHPWGPSSLHPDMVAAVANPRDSLIGYFASITAMDSAIGRILAELDRLDLRRSTLVVFVSDNGFNWGHHGIWGKGNATFPQNAYEESVKVPAIFSMPGVIPVGMTITSLASAYDVLPTILDFCHVEGGVSEEARLPGQSLRPQLTGASFDEQEFVVVFSEYGPLRMIRTVEWKYVRRYPYGPDELYDLTLDPGERSNLVDAPSSSEVIGRLRLELETWFERHSSPWADGTRSPITAVGQTGRTGSRGTGKDPFFQPASTTLPRVDLRRAPIRPSS